MQVQVQVPVAGVVRSKRKMATIPANYTGSCAREIKLAIYAVVNDQFSTGNSHSHPLTITHNERSCDSTQDYITVITCHEGAVVVGGE